MKVTVYSTNTCSYCVKLKRWLDENKIIYTNIFIDSDKQAIKQLITLSNQMSVPVITVETKGSPMQLIFGYDETQLKRLFGQ